MIMQLLKHQRKHVLVDIDTQNDFLSPWGKAGLQREGNWHVEDVLELQLKIQQNGEP